MEFALHRSHVTYSETLERPLRSRLEGLPQLVEHPSLFNDQRHSAARALDSVREACRVFRGHPDAAV